MTYKEFYFWLDGFMTNRDWTTFNQVDIETIKEKMGQVKEERTKSDLLPFQHIPIPVNPFPVQDDPYKPPYEVYCGPKEQLND
jgi:hypothetical protein